MNTREKMYQALEKTDLTLAAQAISENPLAINVKCDAGWPLICIAATQGNKKFFEFLLSQTNIDLEARTPEGDTLLMCTLGQPNLMRKLISRVKLDAVNTAGETALVQAIRNGNAICVNILTQAQASLDVTSQDGRNILELAEDSDCETILQIVTTAIIEKSHSKLETHTPE